MMRKHDYSLEIDRVFRGACKPYSPTSANRTIRKSQMAFDKMSVYRLITRCRKALASQAKAEFCVAESSVFF